MKKEYTIRREKPEDYREVENLTREAFWNVYRPGCTEHYVLHQFRERPEFVSDQAAEEFDREFPPKVKLKLPGQLV